MIFLFLLLTADALGYLVAWRASVAAGGKQASVHFDRTSYG